jgi:O-methyltransferase
MNLLDRLGLRSRAGAYRQPATSDGIGKAELAGLREADAREIEALHRAGTLSALRPRADRAHDLAQLIGTSIGEGLHICHELQLALDADAAGCGAICEFGVAQGATSRLLARELMADARAERRELWLFDSFEGLPKPSPQDRLINDIFNLGSMDAYAGTMHCPRALVEAKLAEIGFPAARTRIKQGWVDAALAAQPLPARVAFAYVDFDFYQPILDALRWLDGVTALGARVFVDDYGFFSEGAQLATDEFVAASGGRWRIALPVPCAGHFAMLARIG